MPTMPEISPPRFVKILYSLSSSKNRLHTRHSCPIPSVFAKCKNVMVSNQRKTGKTRSERKRKRKSGELGNERIAQGQGLLQMITREVKIGILRMTAMIVDAPQARILVTLPLGHVTTIVTTDNEVEVALLNTADDVIMLPTESKHGLDRTNLMIMARSVVEALSAVESAQMKTGNGDVALVLQSASPTRSAHAIALLHVIPVLTSRSSHPIQPKTVLRNWPP
jgi:hypothetical protein